MTQPTPDQLAAMRKPCTCSPDPSHGRYICYRCTEILNAAPALLDAADEVVKLKTENQRLRAKASGFTTPMRRPKGWEL